MVSEARANRIANRIQEELSEVILQRVADPRLSDISITDVKVDRELAYANIYFSALDGTDRVDEILNGFKSARGYLRTELASRIVLRTFPRLRFHWDPTLDQAERIEKLISTLKSSNEQETNISPSIERDQKISSLKMEGSEND